MRISSKPTIYCIDGSNFLRSCWLDTLKNEDSEVFDFLNWLEEVSRTTTFEGCGFRVVFDGVYRDVGPLIRGSIKISFSDEDKADSIVLEQAIYLSQTGKRVRIVTSDRKLMDMGKSEGIKSLFCAKFFRIAQYAIDREYK
jgi:predicted RNA-binding protein with PIN domain